MDRGWSFAKIALYGFCFIFIAIGLGILYGAVAAYQEGDPNDKALIMAIAGLAFGGFGAGVFALINMGMRTKAREDALRTAHPDEPWQWREDWAAGRVRSTGKTAAWFLWGFGILWNLISTPMAFFLPEEIFEKGNTAALLGLLFPLVGIGLIVAAVRKTIQVRKYGNCLFLMDHVPGILGGEVRGSITLPRGLPGASTLTVKLSCVQRITTGSGKNSTTNETVLWQSEQTGVGLAPTGEAAAMSAPVKFRIPFDEKPSGDITVNNTIIWRLQASAAVPGVDYDTTFEIPVYKTRESSSQLIEERVRAEELAALKAAVGSTDIPPVDIIAIDGGGKEFVIKPHRTFSMMLTSLVFIIIFAGVSILLVYGDAPIIFPVVFGAFTLIIALAVLFGAYGESRIIVEEEHVSVRNTLFGLMTGKRMPCATITRIGVKGVAKGGNNSITFTQEDGTTTSPFQSLRTPQQADWLAEEVRKAMEPWRDKKHPPQ